MPSGGQLFPLFVEQRQREAGDDHGSGDEHPVGLHFGGLGESPDELEDAESSDEVEDTDARQDADEPGSGGGSEDDDGAGCHPVHEGFVADVADPDMQCRAEN